MTANPLLSSIRSLGAAAALALFAGTVSVSAQQISAFQQVLASATASEDTSVGTFYRTNGYQPIWTGASDLERARRAALFDALQTAPLHGLPAGRYDVPGLKARMATYGMKISLFYSKYSML